ncbi:MAG: exodeoxyribonuclease V subunit gamma [Steroidobacterales bacterium]
MATLRLHFSNRFETLARLLIGNLGQEARGARDARGAAGVFQPAQVIVPSQAVARSLTLAIADHDGICANVSFDYLARWLWRQISRLVPGVGESSPFEPQILAWHIYRALGDQDFVTAHPRLHGYLARADELMRYELACRLAVLIRDYSTYREDWLEAWADERRVDPLATAAQVSSGEHARADELWQSALYRRIVAGLHVETRHPGSAFIEALAGLGKGAAISAVMPASVHVFALPTMPPQHVRLLAHLGASIDLHLYVLNPCQEYWFEVVDRRRLKRLAAQRRDQYHEEGNRLLAGWGRQTQSHVGLLIDQDGAAVSDETLFEREQGATLLAQLQNSILDLCELGRGSVTLAPDDRSLEVHDCHSLTRELEVLQDYLLELFAGDASGAPPLRPCDVLVVTPDLEAAAPLIEAVFGTAPQPRAIPFQLTGRSRSTVNAPARTLLALLSLAASRFEATAVFDLLEQPIVARRFGLDDEDLQQIRDWVRASGMRWALDDRQRTQFDVPAQAHHTLADGMERLFLGYALPGQAGDALFGQLLPAGNATGSDALALGAFWSYFDALRRLHAAVSAPQRIEAWAQCLSEAIASFMSAASDELEDLYDLQVIIGQLADDMRRGGMSGEVTLAVIQAALAQMLGESAHGGVPSGCVTFTSMASLRSLPFGVVCVIGLNDGAFPTSARPPEFDLMALQVRRGDRQRAEDERNLFLDLVLAARRRLYLSYTGHSVRDNAPLPPSVLVSELLDTVIPAIAGPGGVPASPAEARRRLVVRHPLQAFAAECFAANGERRLRSFNREMGEALRASMRVAAAAPIAGTPDLVADDNALASDEESVAAEWQPPFFTAPLALPQPASREVSLRDLAEFYRNPSRYLLRRRMGIQLPYEPDELPDQEPFALDARGRRLLAARLLPRLIREPGDARAAELIAAGTEMPTGNLGVFERERELSSLRQFAALVRRHTSGECLAPYQVALDIGVGAEGWRLSAEFPDLRAAGLVRFNYSEPRHPHALCATDALDAWLAHLVLCAAPPATVTPRTTAIARNGVWVFRAPQEPTTILAQLLAIYAQGLTQPVHFFPKSAWAYALGGERLVKATGEWRVTTHHPYGEAGDVAYQLAFRGRPEPLDEEFCRLARAVFEPLIGHCDKESPGA